MGAPAPGAAGRSRRSCQKPDRGEASGAASSQVAVSAAWPASRRIGPITRWKRGSESATPGVSAQPGCIEWKLTPSPSRSCEELRRAPPGRAWRGRRSARRRSRGRRARDRRGRAARCTCRRSSPRPPGPERAARSDPSSRLRHRERPEHGRREGELVALRAALALGGEHPRVVDQPGELGDLGRRTRRRTSRTESRSETSHRYSRASPDPAPRTRSSAASPRSGVARQQVDVRPRLGELGAGRLPDPGAGAGDEHVAAGQRSRGHPRAPRRACAARSRRPVSGGDRQVEDRSRVRARCIRGAIRSRGPNG